MKVTATLDNYRRSAKKVEELARVLGGLDANEAKFQLEHLRKGCAGDIKKLLMSAMANAENNFGMDKDNLYIYQVIVKEGPVMKRWRARAFGRAAGILKRTCSVQLTLEEKEEGKGRKKKVKPETKAEKAKNKGEKGKDEKNIEAAKPEVKPSGKPEMNDKEAKNQQWGKKIFRRKSL